MINNPEELPWYMSVEQLKMTDANVFLVVWAGMPPTVVRTGEYEEVRSIISGRNFFDAMSISVGSDFAFYCFAFGIHCGINEIGHDRNLRFVNSSNNIMNKILVSRNKIISDSNKVMIVKNRIKLLESGIYSLEYDDIDDVILRASNEGIGAIIVNGVDKKSNEEILRLVKKYDIVCVRYNGDEAVDFYDNYGLKYIVCYPTKAAYRNYIQGFLLWFYLFEFQ